MSDAIGLLSFKFACSCGQPVQIEGWVNTSKGIDSPCPCPRCRTEWKVSFKFDKALIASPIITAKQ